MFRNRSVDAHQFSMIPRAQIPRSSFRMQKTYKTTFDAGYLIPVYCEEVLPGDSCSLRMTAFARLSTPLFPIMDNCYLESFFFFVPNRLVWNNWIRFMGEQLNPGDSISYVVPQVVSAANGFVVGSIYDYFGLPTVGQVGVGNTVSVNVLPLRAYNLIYNTWFRDENLQSSLNVNDTSAGPDALADYALRRRGKRHDYFTSCLPWPQKGTSPALIITGNATVRTDATHLITGAANTLLFRQTSGAAISTVNPIGTTNAGAAGLQAAAGTTTPTIYPSNLYADLTTATTNTINSLRQSFQIQRLLERDARGGTRYVEIILSHFGVRSPDMRLQRPEYLGGGSSSVSISPVTQNTQTGITGGSTPMGSLAAIGTALAKGHGFSQSFTEHGYIIGIVNVRADLTYQQGLRRHWSRSTRYDYYFPVFAMLGEQAVLNKEIYCRGDANDALVFGYQERWAEYRYNPSEITGLFRSTSAGTIDPWHLSQNFGSLPTLGANFISDAPPFDRIIAVGTGANGKQFLLDAFFDAKWARPMPMYSVPGMIDHF